MIHIFIEYPELHCEWHYIIAMICVQTLQELKFETVAISRIDKSENN